jgi:hypothetical protein
VARSTIKGSWRTSSISMHRSELARAQHKKERFAKIIVFMSIRSLQYHQAHGSSQKVTMRQGE